MATCPTCRTQYPEGSITCAKDGDTLLPDAAFLGLDRELPPGFLVGEYRIEGKIGEGGFGSVYRAVHPLIGKAAAIKILSRQYSSNPVVVARFIAEARAVNQIRHRNIIDIFSFGALDDGRQYLVMELLEGKPLDRYLQEDKGRLTPEEAIPILRGIARALDAAHASGILHRDLKPENIFLSFDEDGEPFPKLLDFGIAKLVGGGKGSDPSDGLARPGVMSAAAKTRTGTPMGTPYYMSPEQCRGKDVDHRTDIYSFGVLAHELLTGDIPFRGEDVVELLMKQTTAEPPPMSSVCPAVPRVLDVPVLKMLAKDPAARPPSAGAAVEALAVAAKDAGFRVTPLASGPVLPPLALSGVSVVSGPRLTPRNATLESAETLDDARTPTMARRSPGPHTFGAAAADVRTSAPRRPNRRALIGFAGVIVIALIGIGMVATGVVGRAKTPLAEITQVSAPASPPVVAPESKVEVAPASKAALPEWATDVAISVEATPANATIWKDGAKIGDAPGPISLPRAQGTVKLTIKAEGHKPSEISVDTTKDATFVVALTKIVRSTHVPAKASATGARSEIPTDINEK
ncbi:protein kinase [Pendulispora rubella]|uniref:Protein kinase n=1 Tax=Pendulispora rubella TaxID=2741070 RepID=A0ABZ2LE90_9BACT